MSSEIRRSEIELDPTVHVSSAFVRSAPSGNQQIGNFPSHPRWYVRAALEVGLVKKTSRKQDLLSLGLVSKIFLHPALDILWKRINGIGPVLSVLPETTMVNGQKMFLQPIDPSSWDRLNFYTSRVREFDDWEPREGSKEAVHCSVYSYLGTQKPIFRNLRTLRISTSHLRSSDSFALFLATTLWEVSWPRYLEWLPEDDPMHDLGDSLAALVSNVPALKSLTLQDYNYSGLSVSLSCLLALEGLDVLSLSRLEKGFIRAIAALPKLINLALSLRGGVLDYGGVESGFPSLKELIIEGSALDLNKFFDATRPKELQELTIEWEYQDVGNPPLAAFAAITPLFTSFPFLRSLTITKSSTSFQDLDEVHLWLIFEPLLGLKSLVYLHFDIPLPLSDQNTARISCAWPHLEELFLTATDDLPSLESLMHFARNSANLKDLSYPIQTCTALQSMIQIPPTISLHPLNRFYCNVMAEIAHAPAIALGLFQIFPDIVQVVGIGPGWGQVQEILQLFIFLQEQNRGR
ncbi:hypothetical protein BDP27DRAFT_1371082 [Rhodocollybia butyracea]|uniref:Uncharacterized protein n=1 Tax=Rhodocollybia butyracea TaxID=206335 RepID=A0A9P5PAY3_9AGAR|nr:hypothetical protein BDP27DRAFT_1371082 [Rhodocollybia butyracea]